MKVYVLAANGQPLMPTERCGKVRRLLQSKQAVVVRHCPFTIKLLYQTKETNIQPITLGIDAGSKHIGISATTTNEALFEADVTLRNDIVELIASRREMRHSRRNRKTRYRPARFDNRRRYDGWLAPSIRQKIQTHLTIVDKVHKILPISSIVAEVASFDIQKIRNADISGEEYQQGEQLGFWNVREYVLFRDGHTCQCCKGKSKDPVLNVHHIESRKTGGNAPNNLITLCETCHYGYHAGTVKFPKSIARGMKFADAAFMGIMRWAFYDVLRERYPDVTLTFGYITKDTRIRNGLPKDHYIDARCISGNPLAKSSGSVYCYQKVRCHNRQLHKCTILKGGYRKNNQAPYEVMGFRLWDKVKYLGKEWFVAGRRQTGYFGLRSLEGDKIDGAGYKKLHLIEKAKHYLVERMEAQRNDER